MRPLHPYAKFTVLTIFHWSWRRKKMCLGIVLMNVVLFVLWANKTNYLFIYLSDDSDESYRSVQRFFRRSSSCDSIAWGFWNSRFLVCCCDWKLCWWKLVVVAATNPTCCTVFFTKFGSILRILLVLFWLLLDDGFVFSIGVVAVADDDDDVAVVDTIIIVIICLFYFSFVLFFFFYYFYYIFFFCVFLVSFIRIVIRPIYEQIDWTQNCN